MQYATVVGSLMHAIYGIPIPIYLIMQVLSTDIWIFQEKNSSMERHGFFVT